MVNLHQATLLSISVQRLQEKEEGNVEESEEESEPEALQITTQRKVGRKSNRNRRENEADRDKELGIQTTLEGILKKDNKQGKGHGQSGKSMTQSHPTKGGASKSSGK
jgi:hypothetical protein